MFKNINDKKISKILAKNDQILSLEDRLIKDYGSEENTLITYDEIKSLVEGKWYWVNPGIRYMPIDLLSDILHLRTVIDNTFNEWWFGFQNHDCWELVVPRFGEFLDNKNGNTFLAGERKIYKPFEKHNPGAKNGIITNIDVYFSKEKF